LITRSPLPYHCQPSLKVFKGSGKPSQNMSN